MIFVLLAAGCVHHGVREPKPIVGYHHVVTVRLVGGWNEMAMSEGGFFLGRVYALFHTDAEVHGRVLAGIRDAVIARLDEAGMVADVDLVDASGFLDDSLRGTLQVTVRSAAADAPKGERSLARAANLYEALAAEQIGIKIREEIESAGGRAVIEGRRGEAEPVPTSESVVPNSE